MGGATPSRAYVVCATPRSGSSVLAGLLDATGVAGRPSEHFETLRETGRPRQPRQYFEGLDAPEVTGLLAPTQPGRPEAPGEFAARLERVLRDGTTPNGVFAATVMWTHLGELLERLAELDGTAGRPAPEALAAVLPRVRYVHMTRRDRFGQAVSLWTALQTQVWREDGERRVRGDAEYTFRAIDHLAAQLEAQDHAWRAWFTANDILPLRVDHEELAADPAQVVLDVLAELGISEPPDPAALRPPMRRRAGARSREWIARYLDERGRRLA